MTTTPIATKPPKRPRGFRISLRVFMLLILVIGGWLGWTVNKIRRVSRAIAEIQRVGGRVYRENEINRLGFGSPGQKRNLSWGERLFGPSTNHPVDTIEFHLISNKEDGVPLQNLAYLSDLASIRRVYLNVTGIDDSVMSGFPSIKGLKIVEIQELKVHDAGLE